MANTVMTATKNERSFPSGRWAFEMISASSGTATFAWRLPGRNAFVNIDNGAFTATATPILQLPDCRLKITMTGDITEVAFERIAEG